MKPRKLRGLALRGPHGNEISPVWGTMIAGTSTAAGYGIAAIKRAATSNHTNFPLGKGWDYFYGGAIGAGAGLGLSTLLLIWRRSRMAGFVGLIGSTIAFVGNAIAAHILLKEANRLPSAALPAAEVKS
jgi:hypothetical protein